MARKYDVTRRCQRAIEQVHPRDRRGGLEVHLHPDDVLLLRDQLNEEERKDVSPPFGYGITPNEDVNRGEPEARPL